MNQNIIFAKNKFPKSSYKYWVKEAFTGIVR